MRARNTEPLMQRPFVMHSVVGFTCVCLGLAAWRALVACGAGSVDCPQHAGAAAVLLAQLVLILVLLLRGRCKCARGGGDPPLAPYDAEANTGWLLLDGGL